MSKPTRVVLVNYLNTLPFLAGLRGLPSEKCTLELAHPADCARILLEGQADYGLVPVGALLDRTDWVRVSRFGIACDGPVATVGLYGDTPLAEWREVVLDGQSRTSVRMARFLMDTYWDRKVTYLPAYPGYEEDLGGNRGGLIIGDRAIQAGQKYPVQYDLGEAWRAHTGLPFVFAIWVRRPDADPAFQSHLDRSLENGLEAIPGIITQNQKEYPGFDLDAYYRTNIRYELTPEMLSGLRHYARVVGASQQVSLL